MERTYHIVRRPVGLWEAKATGKEMAVLVANTREDIVEEIFELGRSFGHTRVIVHAPDGGSEERYFALAR